MSDIATKAPRVPLMGHFYTMSKLKHPCGDRSWMHEIWEVLESNGTHVLIRTPFAEHESCFGFRPMVVAVCEFDWTPADEFADAMLAASTQSGDNK